MQPASQPDNPLASIEQRLSEIQQTLQHQGIAIARLQDELSDATRRDDWYHVQFGEMLRTVARDMRELRASLIASVLSDGQITAQTLQVLLRETPEDLRPLEQPIQPPCVARKN